MPKRGFSLTVPRGFVALVLLGILAACGGGGGGGVTPPGGQLPNPTPSPTPTPLPSPTMSVGTSGTPVPAPSATALSEILTGGNAAYPYIEALATTIATPPPPSGNVAIVGVIQIASTNTLTISTSGTTNNAALFMGTNFALPSTLTVSFTSQTLIDSPRGASDLTVGTPIIAAGQISQGTTLNASAISPITSSTVTAGFSRRAASLRLISVARGGPPSQEDNRNSERVRPMGTSGSDDITFSESKGIPGINNTYAISYSLGKCATISLSTTAVAGLGVKYSWPMAIQAGESAPITIGGTGTVSLTAQPITPPPTSPNFVISDGLALTLSGTISYSCGLSIQYSFGSAQVGLALAINDNIPAQFGTTATTLDAGTLLSAGNGNVVCLQIAPLPDWYSVSALSAAPSLQVCPRATLDDGGLKFASFTGSSATVLSTPMPLSPSSSLTIDPNGNPYSITGAGLAYQYSQQAGLDVQLLLFGQTVASAPLDAPAVPMAPPADMSSLSWSLDAASPSPTPTPSPSSSPTSTPASSALFVGIGYSQNQNSSNAIAEYASPFSGQPTLMIGNNGLEPNSIAFDAHGNLFVVTQECYPYVAAGNGCISEYAPPYNAAPFQRITAGSCATYGSYNPGQIAFDSSGDLFVTDTYAGCIEKYFPPYSGAPSVIVSGGIGSMVVDANGDVLATLAGLGTLVKYAPPYSSPPATIDSSPCDDWLALDPVGNVWVADPPNLCSPARVLEFSPPYTSGPSVSITNGVINPFAFAFDNSGDLFLMNRTTPGNVVEYAPPYTAPPFTISSGISTPAAIDVDVAGNLFVLNQGNGNVTVYQRPYTGPPWAIINSSTGVPVSIGVCCH